MGLSDFIRTEQNATLRVGVFRSVGEAVCVLHAMGWIHGDLACRNLMVLPEAKEVAFVDLARVKPIGIKRMGWRRRKELYRLVKSADKCGADEPEVAAMLEAAVGEHAESVIRATRSLRAIRNRSLRKLRAWSWRLTGVVP